MITNDIYGTIQKVVIILMIAIFVTDPPKDIINAVTRVLMFALVSLSIWYFKYSNE